MKFFVLFALLAIIGCAVSQSSGGSLIDGILKTINEGVQDVIRDVRGISRNVGNMQDQANEATRDDTDGKADKDGKAPKSAKGKS